MLNKFSFKQKKHFDHFMMLSERIIVKIFRGFLFVILIYKIKIWIMFKLSKFYISNN